jgi:hypothetical protein
MLGASESLCASQKIGAALHCLIRQSSHTRPCIILLPFSAPSEANSSGACPSYQSTLPLDGRRNTVNVAAGLPGVVPFGVVTMTFLVESQAVAEIAKAAAAGVL